MRTPRLIPTLLAAACAAAVVPFCACLADLKGWDGGEDQGDLVKGLETMLGKQTEDLDLLRLSHYTELNRWEGVAPEKPEKGTDLAAFAWQEAGQQAVPPRVLVRPLGSGAARTVLAVPETRDYRVWLGYRAEPGKPHPVTLTAGGATATGHVYGAFALTRERGEDQEKARPVRFEDELARMNAPAGPVVIWEYADLRLQAGTTTLALESADPASRVDGVFLTASKAFAPSKSHMAGEGNLYKSWYRVRAAGTGGIKAQGVDAMLGYHWARVYDGEKEPSWRMALGSQDKKGFVSEEGAKALPEGVWTRWVDCTEDVMNGPWARGGGPWATGRFEFKGVKKGEAEVQLAWHPHEGAVLKTIKPGIAEGSAVCMIPLEGLWQSPVSGTGTPAGVWGMRRVEALARLETAGDVHKRHFQWGGEALAKLGLKEGAPLPKRPAFTTGCTAAPADRETAYRMLARLGINTLGIQDEALRRELGQEDTVFIGANDSQYLMNSHDPLDPAAERNFEATLRGRAAAILKGKESAPPLVTLKMGDEIGAVAGAASINGLETLKKAFHDYLRARLAERETDAAAWYGAETVEELPYLGEAPERASLFERRLFYDCSRFKFVVTALYYAQLTRAAERVFPRVRTYCNFSPHPPMFGQHMNGSDWFVLTREGGANMAWGEDWASGGSWGFVGREVVSYYGAWVECAARTRKLPAGFYVVGTMGGTDKKIFSLLPRGIDEQALYSWGPLYSVADGQNSWSESKAVYEEIARGTHAVGPADAIIADGVREPRRAALLYNRTHEIWNGGESGFQSERLLEFMALTHAHIPVEIILEEDCTEERLAGYKVVYIQGHNLEARRVAALKRWVEAGGVLVGVAGTALRDESDTPTAAGAELFGATQAIAGTTTGSWHPQQLPEHVAIDVVTLRESELTPALAADVIGLKVELTPTTGKPVGVYSNGACAAVINTVGKGRTLLLGFMPGQLYKGTAKGGGHYMLERRGLVTKPAEAVLGRQRVEYSEPQTEVWLFETGTQAAVTLNNAAYFLEPADRAVTLTVQTELPVKDVVSTLKGPLAWKREGDRIRVDMTAPETVDTVIFR